ncbi:MAG TPA: DUF3300 domain-containing protein [Trinickia sp.]|uniref:DUF3300 domain-containing protein n=1 Tax=Trinickia sp. TaxID=2571163 RepID=UPI002CD3447B|nr:DUF3300 domain-containing protein [Trinickia sp.]HTI18619.1 DUF3300 domain-containing protein [Trinickia sp.]
MTAEQLQQLVAPIALYPDALVAQIFAASTQTVEVVEADRWVTAHPELKGDALANEVNTQSWDPSVKALTEFPSVLANLDQNLTWTSSLGDAYKEQPQALMAAVQAMRQRAEQAGTLTSTGQQTVTTDDQAITIEPTDADLVYVPQYDPWLAYGEPVAAWPGWYPYPGLYFDGPGLAFGVGFGVWYFGNYGWGWNHWRPDWRHRAVTYQHGNYAWHDRAGIDRDNFVRQSGEFGTAHAFNGERTFPGSTNMRIPQQQHGFAAPQTPLGINARQFSGVTRQGFIGSGEAGHGREGFGDAGRAGEGRFGGGGFGGGGGHGGGGHR